MAEDGADLWRGWLTEDPARRQPASTFGQDRFVGLLACLALAPANSDNHFAAYVEDTLGERFLHSETIIVRDVHAFR